MRNITLTAAAALVLPGFAMAQDAVQIDGSSTVYPVSEAFAEEFQIATGNRVVVGVSGTGGGFKKFCRGETSFSGASRPIKTSEAELCAENGIEFIEMPLAMDALAVIANPENTWATCMTVEELKKAYEPEAQGKINNWSQLNPEFPDHGLTLFGAGTDSGTYDYFTFAIVGEEGASRGDFTATEDDNITIQGVSTDVDAIGFLGLAYLEENRSRVKAVEISYQGGDCVAPTVEAAGDGSYQPLTRPLFIYANKAHLDEKPEVLAYAKFMFDPEHAQELVSETGYLALPKEAFVLAEEKIDARKTGSFFDGGSKIGVSVADLLAAN
ncbi:PstS family phosphate ABC transporter substrate-binding protein [Pseudorhodobacter aquimaris]|uniref:PstS family phosphate ABC transporter substrate-binding protein n=1 Tax=Pseudorhodobacter aquimaris TaxID=687412 RepID=UPI0009FA7AE3|nr:PstS family phosphate ABC transporter substrate-binding protein [Pseudorhodobacter aquimaris]